MEPPAADEEECASASSGIILAVISGLVCLIIGFIIGTRARQMAEALKAVGSLLKRVPFTLQISKAEEDGKAEEVENDGDDDEAEKLPEEILDPFLSTELGLDIHPDLVINPIMMYHIKQVKERLREEQRMAQLEEMRQQLIAEGLSESQAEERVAFEAESGAMISGGKLSALSVLINAGARVTPTGNRESQEQIILNDMRRQKKNIEVYLSKQHEIDVTMTKPEERSKRVGLEGTRMGPLEMAVSTAKEPVGGPLARRSAEMVETARTGRLRLASAVATNKSLAEKLEDFKASAKANARRQSRKLPPKDRRAAAQLEAGGAGGLLDADSLAQLMAEAEEEGEEQDDAQDRAVRRSIGANDDDEEEEGDGDSSEGYYDA